MRNLAKKIKILRITNDWTQKELADMIGVKEYIISNIEQGRSDPAIDIILKLCIAFNISADELLEIDTNEKRRQIHINSNGPFTNNGIINSGNISSNNGIINTGNNIHHNFTGNKNDTNF